MGATRLQYSSSSALGLRPDHVPIDLGWGGKRGQEEQGGDATSCQVRIINPI